ncbi:hypothetical protein [Amycolatopsis sp. CA-230715]|uniref:hypothetical protein n=1 Tax=Amycolatopsis sp. CA-230715 TaxID=2745196 RepID=UPI001C012ED3|nr:hypothetical protein [Amycolatopsis sp. CA-230715]
MRADVGDRAAVGFESDRQHGGQVGHRFRPHFVGIGIGVVSAVVTGEILERVHRSLQLPSREPPLACVPGFRGVRRQLAAPGSHR